MNKILMMAVTAATAFALNAAEMSLADARSKIGEVVQDPAKMTDVVKNLSADDQVKYLSEVNEAIGNMPGSNEEKSAKYLNVNKAAMKGASKGNLTAMIAETYATVPPEALTVINERFAADLFNRAADPSVSYTDEEYLKICKTIMDKVNDRCTTSTDARVRTAFAGLMCIRAANGSPADIVNQVTEMLPFDAQNTARTEWYKPALGDGEPQTYEPMLDAASAGPLPANDLVIRMAGPQMLDALLGDTVEWVPLVKSYLTPMAGGGAGAGEGMADGDVGMGAGATTPDLKPVPSPTPDPGPGPEPGPYYNNGRWY